MKPAVAVLSTGSVCFPLNRPILAFYHSKVQPFLDMNGYVIFIIGIVKTTISRGISYIFSLVFIAVLQSNVSIIYILLMGIIDGVGA